jgi:glyoxylase-like metal-dependent hydrolase (beta-lactamase superfamily II)
MLLRQFMLDVGPLESNCWLMADEKSREAFLVDAGAFEPAVVVLVAQRGLRLSHILLTHLHWDHVDGLPRYRDQFPEAAIVAPSPVPGCSPLLLVADGDQVEVGPYSLQVLKTSGHTPESISYYCRSAGVCFVGDAIFAGAVGGTPSDERFEEQMSHIQLKLMTLPPDTLLLSGHGPATTVAVEQAANPFLKPGFGRA